MSRTLTAAIVILLAFRAIPAFAQDPEHRQQRERDDVHLRNDCRLAVQVLSAGQPATKREWALDTINLCDESGPPVLARMWRESGADSASVDEVIYRSVYLRDRRVYDVVSAIASDRSVLGLKRAAALHLLGRWAEPGFSLEFGAFFAPGYEPAEWHGGRSAVNPSFISHDTQYEGAEPLPATIKSEVVGLSREIAAHDPDFRVRATAEQLVRWLTN